VNSSSDKSVRPQPKATTADTAEQPSVLREPQIETANVMPTLSTYFGTPPVSVPAFLKAMKTEKITRFSDTDIANASSMIVEHDSDGARLLALTSQPTLPEAIDRCIWPLVQSKLKSEIPSAFDTAEIDASSTFRLLYEGLTPSILSTEKRRRQKGETLLRLGLRWLLLKRSLDPWTVLEHLGPTFYKDAPAIIRAARRVVGRGKIGDIKLAIGIAALAQDKVRSARGQRDEEAQRTFRLQAQLNESQARLRELKSMLESSERERDQLTAKLLATEQQLVEVQQHAGHDYNAIRSQHRILLVEKIRPLLNDAVDALEIVPPAPTIAINRIKAALSAVDEADR